jgi:serine/threonine protein kinase
MHRDIKPSNILIDEYSRIMMCDFGMARTVPILSKDEKELKNFRKDEYKQIIKSKDRSTRAANLKVFKGRMSSFLK